MDAYRTIYRLIFLAGQTSAMVGGVIVIIALTLLGGNWFSAAIPYATLWVVFCVSLRFVLVVLPKPPPAAGGTLPGEKPLPKAAMAVSITDPCLPEACPDRDAMTAALPEHVRALIR